VQEDVNWIYNEEFILGPESTIMPMNASAMMDSLPFVETNMIRGKEEQACAECKVDDIKPGWLL
jgi:hypothetical protein